jgi:Ni,Fe-hydrogenase III component G
MAEPLPVAAGLAARFPSLAGAIAAPRPRRVGCLVPAALLHEVIDHAVEVLGFDRLCAITGYDERTAFAASYALGRADGTVLSLRTRMPHERPVLRTVTGRFPGAANYERELVDLFGFEVEGLPPGKRYPLPDDWPLDQKPLRKDWAAPPPEPPAPSKRKGP